MEMVIQLLLLALGFFMLVKGADWFVDGSSGIADKLGVPQLVIGLTIVAMGTIQLLLLALGFFMLVKGADWFVDGSSGIADKLGVPQLVIGLTIVAMGTSAPEAAVSITAALKGSAEITIGNIVGSNILNILIILGITSAIVSVAVAKSTIRYEIPWMLFITAVLLALGYTGNQVSFMEGVILWVLFLMYLG